MKGSVRERVGPTIDNLHLVQSSYRVFRQFLSDFQHFSRRVRFHPTCCLAYPGFISHLQVLSNPAPRHSRSAVKPPRQHLLFLLAFHDMVKGSGIFNSQRARHNLDFNRNPLKRQALIVDCRTDPFTTLSRN